MDRVAPTPAQSNLRSAAASAQTVAGHDASFYCVHSLRCDSSTPADSTSIEPWPPSLPYAAISHLKEWPASSPRGSLDELAVRPYSAGQVAVAQSPAASAATCVTYPAAFAPRLFGHVTRATRAG